MALKLTSSSSQNQGVLEFGEGAHLAAAIASQLPDCESVSVRYDFQGYADFREEQQNFHAKICEYRGLQFEPIQATRHPEFASPNASTELIYNEDGKAHTRIREAFDAVALPRTDGIREFLKKRGFKETPSAKVLIWVRISKTPSNRDLCKSAFENIRHLIPSNVTPIVIGNSSKWSVWPIYSLQDFFFDGEFPQGQPYETNLALFRVLRDEHSVIGCIGMMCGGTDLVAFQGVPFASITFADKRTGEPSARMKVMAECVPCFSNVLLAPGEYDARRNSPLPPSTRKQLTEEIKNWS